MYCASPTWDVTQAQCPLSAVGVHMRYLDPGSKQFNSVIGHVLARHCSELGSGWHRCASLETVRGFYCDWSSGGALFDERIIMLDLSSCKVALTHFIPLSSDPYLSLWRSCESRKAWHLRNDAKPRPALANHASRSAEHTTNCKSNLSISTILQHPASARTASCMHPSISIIACMLLHGMQGPPMQIWRGISTTRLHGKPCCVQFPVRQPAAVECGLACPIVHPTSNPSSLLKPIRVQRAERWVGS